MSAREILSEDEIYALLNQEVKNRPNPEQAAKDGVPPNFYDFICEYHTSITRTDGFTLINTSIAREISDELGEILRQKIHIEVLSPEVLTIEQYLNNQKTSSILSIYTINSTKQPMITLFDQRMLATCTELLFGGSAYHLADDDHTIGIIDNKLSKQFSSLINNIIKRAWKPFLPLELEYLCTTSDYEKIKIFNAKEKMIVLTYAFQFDGSKSSFDICLPHTLIQSVSDKLSRSESSNEDTHSREEWATNLEQNIYDVNINLNAIIAETDIKLKDVANLSVGDVITIDNTKMGYLTAEGVKLFKIRCGAEDGSKIVEIVERIDRRKS